MLDAIKAQVPWILVACVFVAILATVGFALGLKFLRDFRDSLVSELSVHLKEKEKPAPMTVQSPLEVKAHVEFTPLGEHNALKTEVHAMRSEMRTSFDKVRDDRSRSVGNLHESIEEMDKKNEHRITEIRTEMKGENQGLHNRLTEVLGSVRELKGRLDEALRK